MSVQNYKRLGVLDFARHLVLSGDLDPVYIMLNCSPPLDESMKLRWLVAYAAFYNCGAASYISEAEGKEFWELMIRAAFNETETPIGTRWPRAAERRHFRGAQSVRAVKEWSERYKSPEDMFDYIAGKSDKATFDEVSKRAREHRSVGDWLGFKIVDLVDATLGVVVDQSNTTPFLYDTPRNSLIEIGQSRCADCKEAAETPERVLIDSTIGWLRKALSNLSIPHKPWKQPLDMFCIETIACKYASHLSGHYPVGKDTREIRHALREWAPESRMALRLLAAVPIGQ